MAKRAAIILSGGRSERFQNAQEMWQDKALVELLGKPLLVHSVENVQEVVEEVVICVNNEKRKAKYSEVLKKHGIKRIECDVIPQGVGIDKGWGFRCSFYVPWTYVTGARTCLLAGIFHPQKTKFITQQPCARPCKKFFIKYNSESETLPLAQRGNSIFYNNISLVKNFAKKKKVFDRIILENLFL